MRNTRFPSLEKSLVINSLKKAGITDLNILDAVQRVHELTPDLTNEEIFPEAIIIQLLKPNKPGKVLTVGKHPMVMYMILGKVAEYVRVLKESQQDAEEMMNILKKFGYGNVYLGTQEDVSNYAPYQNIIFDESATEDPEVAVGLLEKGGTIVIKKIKSTGEVVKATKTDTGYFREVYDEEYRKYNSG